MTPSGFRRLLVVLLWAAAIFWPSGPGHTKPDFQLWRILPLMDSLHFSPETLGLHSADGHYYVLNRHSGDFGEIKENRFLALFPDAPREKPVQSPSPKSPRRMLLKSSNGTAFKARGASCLEAPGLTHRLWMGDRPVADYVHPCLSISAVEIVGHQLWLGTQREEDGRPTGGQGIVIQALNGSERFGQINTQVGLSGDLIQVIRLDPFSGNIWVVTQEGLDEIRPDLSVANSWYFYRDFDAETRRFPLLVSRVPTLSHPFAIINGALAAGEIPPEAFVPPELNGFAPFFIEAAQSDETAVRQTALKNLCMFEDERVLDFLTDLKRRRTSGPEEARMVRNCLAKYSKWGIGKDYESTHRTQTHLDRLREALQQIQELPPGEQIPYALTQAVVHATLSLRNLENTEGFEILLEYFQETDGSPRDGSLYGALLASRLSFEAQAAESVLAGLKNLRTDDLYRGCSFFDMRHEAVYGPRYHPRYAEALLIALQQGMRKKDWKEDAVVRICTEAFKSQVKNQEVRRVFQEQVYPNLSQRQKSLADRLMALAESPYEETWEGRPDLLIESLFPVQVQAGGGETFLLRENTANRGDLSSEPTITRYYLSLHPAADPDQAQVIGQRAVPHIPPASASESRGILVVLPEELPEGLYYIVACADASAGVQEINEANNCLAEAGYSRVAESSATQTP